MQVIGTAMADQLVIAATRDQDVLLGGTLETFGPVAAVKYDAMQKRIGPAFLPPGGAVAVERGERVPAGRAVLKMAQIAP